MSTEMIVYSKFEVRRKDGEKVKFRIQNLTEGLYDKVMDVMLNRFSKEEIFFKTAGVFKSSKAIEEMQNLYRKMYKGNAPALICCVDDEEGDIAGCNLLLKDENDNKLEEIIKQVQAPEILTMFRIVKTAKEYYKIFKEMDIKVYMSGAGLYVNPEFRGCGVATELLKARKPLCEELKISVTGAWFTGLGSQKAAEKAGYELLCEVPYDELGEKAGVTFIDVPKSCKLLVLRVDVF